jgi:hypothetical protein
MFYSIVFLLFPIWILYKKKEEYCFHNKKIQIKAEITDFIHEDNTYLSNKIILLKHKKGNYSGFDLTKNNSVIIEENYTKDYQLKNNTKLQQIINNFRKLKQLNLLQSPFISEIDKLRCAEEILEDTRHKKKQNDFWETYEDMFF